MTKDDELIRRWDALALVEHHVTDDDDRMTLRASISAIPAAPTPPEVLALVEKADDALSEAEAILGGEYGDFYAPLLNKIGELRAALAELKGTTND